MTPSERLRARLDPTLATADAEWLAARMTERRGSAGDVVVRRGEWGDTLTFVLDGELCARVDVDGAQLDLARIGPGHWFGELQFIEPGPASATVVALTDFVALQTRSDEIDELLADRPQAAAALIRALLVEMCERLATTSAGVLERTSSTEYKIATPEHRKGWMGELLSRLFGGGGQR